MADLTVPLGNMSVHQLYKAKYEPWTDYINIEAERYAAITYYSLALLLALTGNTIILLATTKYKAIKLDKVTVILVQHLAVSDIGNATVGIIPSLVTLIADRWTFGSVLCHVLTYIRMCFYYSSVFLVCALNTCKLCMLLFPFQARQWSKRRGHLVAAVAWSIYILFQSVALICGKFSPIFFEYRIMSCWYVPADLGIGAGGSVLIFLGLLGYAPILIVLGTTTGLLCVAFRIAKRGRDSVQWQGVVTVLSIAGIYCLTYLPFSVYHTIYYNLYLDPDQSGMSLKTKAVFYLQLFTITHAIAYLNNFANIFIYYISIASFKRFIHAKLPRALQPQQDRNISNSFPSGAGPTQQSTL